MKEGTMKEGAGAGYDFQKATRYSKKGMPPRGGFIMLPDDFKEYPEAIRTIDLNKPEITDAAGIWSALESRRSVRNYTPQPMSPDELAALLWAGNGITAVSGGWPLRTAPSAGALYPTETYVAVNNVDGLAQGLYHLNVKKWQLELLREADMSMEAAEACLGQRMCATAGAVFFWTGVVARSGVKYGQRAFRYIYLDAAHVAANVHLAAETLGLGCCMIAAFFDDAVADLLGVDIDTEPPVYAASIGKK